MAEPLHVHLRAAALLLPSLYPGRSRITYICYMFFSAQKHILPLASIVTSTD